MSDEIVINITPDPSINISAVDSNEEIALNPLTLNQGLINHSVTHQKNGSDELAHNLLGGLQGGSGNQFYHLTSGEYSNLVTGSVVRPNETGNFITNNQTGQFYANSNPSGFITGVDLSSYATQVYVTGVSGELQNQISNLNNQTGSFYLASNPSGFITGVDLSFSGNYYTKNESESRYVNTTGAETILGDKTFHDKVYINNLYVTGTETIVNTTNTNVASNYLILNLTGGAVDGGLFFITGSGLTGINDSGAIIGFDHSDKFKFGIGTRASDLSVLNTIAAHEEVTGISGNLQIQITNLDNATGSYVLNSETGSFITGIDNLVYTTGDQIKSGRLIIGNDQASIVDPNSQYTLSLQTNSPATWLEILNNSGANQGVFFGIQDNDFEQYNWQGGDIKFFTSENPSDGIERLRITKAGNVGIGTNSPSEKLEISDNIKVGNSGFFVSGIKVGNNSIYITENRIDGGYSQSGGSLTDGLLGIQYSGYFSGDPDWFKTATLRPIINELILTGVSSSGTYTRVGDQNNQGTNSFQGPNGWLINYYNQFPSAESYWYLHPADYVQHYTSSDLETWSLAQNIQAWDGGETYNINDIVSHGGSNWICKAYAPVGYGPFGGYLDGTANGTDYWDELPATQTSTVTQTQNFENSTNFGANRALSNGTSWEWVGYFVPQVTEDYDFYLYADDDAYFWIGDGASNGYTSGNADISTNTSNALQNLSLNSGQSYPVRLQWGHKLTPTNLGLSLNYQIPNLSFNSYDFSGVFFQGSTGKGFYIDAVSGDASFDGNVQANSATFNTRPTVNGTGILLSGEAASLPTTIVYTTGNQTISGTKNFNVRPTVSTTGVVLMSETGQFYAASNPSGYITGINNVVFTTGNQTISGTKNFNVRPTVSTTGVVLVSETGQFYAASNPSGYITGINNVVFTTGNQTIQGQKTFTTGLIIQSAGNQITLKTGSAGNSIFIKSPETISANCTYTIPDVGAASAAFVLTQGSQNIDGPKAFLKNLTVSGVNLIVGSGHNVLSSVVNSIIGGELNTLRSSNSFIGGGSINSISSGSFASTIINGELNQISTNSPNAIIIGGESNGITSNSQYSTIVGGLSNTIRSSTTSFIGAGDSNDIRSGSYNSNIGGGSSNTILTGAYQSNIIGGTSNTIGVNAFLSTIGGGRRATVLSNHSGASILADAQDRDHYSKGPNTCSLDFINGVYLRLPSFSGTKNQSGNPGELAISGSYLYVCTGTNGSGWARMQLTDNNF